MYGGNDIEFRGDGGQSRRGRHGFELLVGAVTGEEARLRERKVEARGFRRQRQPVVILKGPVRALCDVRGDEPTADIGHPIGELNFHPHSIPLGQMARAANKKASHQPAKDVCWSLISN